MRKFYTCALLSITVLFANKLKAQVDVNDSLALVALYDSANGHKWVHKDNWLTTNPVSTWYGIYLTDDKKRVTGILLEYNNLRGNIPEEVFNCTKLNNLSLDHNKLTGTISPNIGNCKELSYLNLYTNLLTGSLPTELGQLSGLKVFDASSNQLSGSIPFEIGNLDNLSILELDGNSFNGTIPESIGNLTSLSQLYLNNNQLSGSLPASLGNLVNCKSLYLRNNQFSGSIPAEISKLHSYYILDLGNNQFSGQLDSGLFNNILYLYLDHNQLSGKLPENNSATCTLKQLDLSYNQLTGAIPASLIASAQYLRGLKLDNNNFNGEMPATFGNLSQLKTLNISHNNLSGAIPSELGNTHHLRNLVLSFNNLQGAIPGSFHNLHWLRKFDVRGNRLSGKVLTFQNFKELGILNVLENYFTFDGIEELIPYYAAGYFKYYAQKNIDIHQKGKKLFVYAGGTLSNNTYKWYRDGHLSAKIIGDSTFTPSKDGNYTVQVTNSIATELTLYSDTITYSKGKVSDAVASSINKNNFSLYPNPAKTYTTVSFSGAGNYIVRLNDANGNLLQTKNITAVQGLNNVTINVSSYAAGLYFITLIDDKKQVKMLWLNKL